MNAIKKASVKSPSVKAKSSAEELVIQGDHCTLFIEFDISLFREGKHYRLYKHLGAHPVVFNGERGLYFSVWAPGANYVSVIGDFNGWDKTSNILQPRWDGSGIWECFVHAAAAGQGYKFHIGNENGHQADKADPFAFATEIPPHTASKLKARTAFSWSDKKWLTQRGEAAIADKPMSTYEVHIGSWRRVPEEGNRWLTYLELSEQLPAYCAEMGFTHVELLPVMEHPFFGSWGYQLAGYFAPSSRFGSVEDFKQLINELHKRDIGVILDWVPSHFPGDEHGLYYFDGTHLFEHADPREGYHPDWKSYIFNYGRNEVRSFLISNALFWLDEFHIDGLRVDAVASMLYRDYSRKEGEWIPNIHGGRENLEAIAFLQQLNTAIHELQPGTFTVAEESTAFPGVTRSPASGGLGFDFKWMMGWMHDSIEYFKLDPLYRRWHQDQLSFSIQYAFTEKFVLPFSHDEVVHGKHAMLNKMPGDQWQQMANLRMLYGYMYGHPGAKLLFMGCEFGQLKEWQHEASLDWHLLDQPFHKGLQQLVADLNRTYRSEPALFSNSYDASGFEWIDHNDGTNSVFCWLRKDSNDGAYLLFVANCTPNILQDYRIGVPAAADFTELLNTDQSDYGGSNTLNKDITVVNIPSHGKDYSLVLTLPPLSVLILKPVAKDGRNIKKKTTIKD